MAAEPPKTPLTDAPVELIDLGFQDEIVENPKAALQPRSTAPGEPWAPTTRRPMNATSELDLEAQLGLGSGGGAPPVAAQSAYDLDSLPTLDAVALQPVAAEQKAQAEQLARSSGPSSDNASNTLPTLEADVLLEDATPQLGAAPDPALSDAQDPGFAERTLTTDTSALQAASRQAEQQHNPPVAAAPSPQTRTPDASPQAAPVQRSTALKKRLQFGAASVLACVAAAGGAVWLRGNTPPVAPTLPATSRPAHTPSGSAAPAERPVQAPMQRTEPPAAPRPHLALVPSPTAVLPAPKTTPLTLWNVDRLDYVSLRAGAAALAEQTEPSGRALRLWALFRLAHAFDDRQAQASLAEALTTQPGRLSALGQLAQCGYKALSGRLEASMAALRGLKRATAQLPQAVWLSLWASSRAEGGDFVPRAKQLKALEQLALGPKAAPDAQVLLAQWWLRVEPRRATLIAGWAQAAQKRGDADLQARLLDLLVTAEAWPVLDTALGAPADDADASAHLALVQAAPAHQDLLWRLRMHRQVRLGDFATALQLAAQRAHGAPDNAEAQGEWRRLAQYLQAQGTDRAAGAPKTTAAPGADPAGDMMQASRQLFDAIAQGDADAARGPVAKMLALSAGMPAPWAQLAEAERGGHWQDAARTLDGLLWRDPTVGDPVDDMLQLIELTHRGGNGDRAVCEAQALLKNLPQDDRPSLLLAQMAHDAHHPEDEIRWLSPVVERHPSARAPTLALAMALTDAQRAPDALGALARLTSLDSQAHDAEFLYVQGRALAHTNPVAACSVLSASAKAKPQPKTYLLLSEIQQARGQLDAAAAALRQAIAAAPEQWALRVALARLLLPQRAYGEAAEVLHQVLDAAPDAMEAAELLGDVLRAQGEFAAAAQVYMKASHSPKAPATLLFKLALVQLHELRDLAAAEISLRRTTATDPKMPEPYYYLGLALHDRNADAEAKKQLQIYLRLSPDGAFVADVKEALQGL